MAKLPGISSLCKLRAWHVPHALRLLRKLCKVLRVYKVQLWICLLPRQRWITLKVLIFIPWVFLVTKKLWSQATTPLELHDMIHCAVNSSAGGDAYPRQSYSHIIRLTLGRHVMAQAMEHGKFYAAGFCLAVSSSKDSRQSFVPKCHLHPSIIRLPNKPKALLKMV